LAAHGDTRTDDWYWLADRDDPEVIGYLRAENEYADAILAPTQTLQQQLFEEIRNRVRETDAGPPFRHGPWWYFSRTVEGQQYPIMCRRADRERSLAAPDVVRDARSETAVKREDVLLDENALAGDSDYLAVGVFDVSPDHTTLAYATDFDGSESYTLRFKNLESGAEHPDVIEGVYYGSAWAPDNVTFFYVKPDPAMRPWQVWRHGLGGSDDDELVFQEDDERFFLEVSLSRSERRIVIDTASKTSSETRWIDARCPGDPARVLIPRQPGIEYDAEHDGDGWLIRSNRPGEDGEPATNFAVWRLAGDGEKPEDVTVLVAHRADVKLESVESFAGHRVLRERSAADGLEQIRIIDRASGSDHLVAQPEPVYSLLGDHNPEWNTTSYRFGYTSLVTPRGSVEYDVGRRRRTIVWSQVVGGGYDPSRYRTERLWAPAADGVQVPLSIVALKGRPLDGSAPCLLYGYGAYEATIDPSFSLTRVNLIDRGACFAIAHVRGGGELGREWYEQGRMSHKVNTFTDFVAAAAYLGDSGWADRRRIVARGASAGGLLMGAVTNMRPDLWRAVVAEVPFVDVVTTMSDTTLPLTVTEWEEWGDPVHDDDAYHRMLSYSPYDNVKPGAFPAIFVTAGLNDPRVGFWEPAKWVAKLRAVGAGGEDRPVLLRTELGAGHGGPTGRYDAWKDEARIQAFVLSEMGLVQSGRN
jgi:oligopeptidase B